MIRRILSKKFKMAVLLGMVTFLFYTCTSDNKADLFPCGSLANMSYSLDVKDILSVNCYDCHSNANAPFAGNGIKLEDYSDVRIYVNSGQLVCAINHNDGCVPMPYLAGTKISNCSISKIEAWIDQGAKDN